MKLDRAAGVRLVQTPVRESMVVAGVVAVLYLALRMTAIQVLGAFHDDAVYVALGKAIASGEGYRSIYAVGAPVHLKYPPGLPVIYAALWTLSDSLSFVSAAAQTLSLLVTAACAGVLWWTARVPLALDRGVTTLWVAGPFLLEGSIQFLNLTISEPYFMLGWALALMLFYRLRDTAERRVVVGLAMGLGLALAATTLMRTQGIVLIPALVIGLWIDRRDWRATGIVAAAALAPVVLWQAFRARLVALGPISTQPDEAPYTGWLAVDGLSGFTDFVQRAVRVNWNAYLSGFPGYFSDARSSGIALMALFSVLAAVGGALLLRRHAALVLSTAATVTLIMIWPWPQDRFLISFFPFTGLLSAHAIQAALSRARPQLRVGGYVTLALLALSIGDRQIFIRSFAYGDANPRDIVGFSYSGYFLLANSRYLTTASQGVARRTTAGDRLVVDAPAAIYLYTGRRGVAATPAESEIEPSVFDTPGRYLASRIRDDSVTVVVLGEVVRNLTLDVAAFYQRCPGLLRFEGAERSWATALFYRVQRNDACMNRELLSQ